MPVGYHHLHYRDFAAILGTAGMKPELEKLTALEVEEKELRRQAGALHSARTKLANSVLESRYAELRPLLRPCHQRRFDGGKKEIEPEPRGWI